MAMSLPAVAHRLRSMREALGLNQADFARSIDIAANRWNQYEKGERMITLAVATACCEAHGVTLDWIYRGDPSGLPMRLHQRLRTAA